MACNTYMYILYYLLYAGIGFWSLKKLLKMEKSLMNSSYQHLPGVDPENSEKGGWDTRPLVSYTETFYCSVNSIKINKIISRKKGPVWHTPKSKSKCLICKGQYSPSSADMCCAHTMCATVQ